MSDAYRQLETLLGEGNYAQKSQLTLKHNPSGLPSAWMHLSASDIPRFTLALATIGGRLATLTVYRTDPVGAPGTHEVAYHLLLDGLPITVKVVVKEGESLSSIARTFPNADWEEREVMELGLVRIDDHPNPKRMFLDETIAAGVFDRFVPYSEFTNVAKHKAVWERIKEESCQTQQRKQEAGESLS